MCDLLYLYKNKITINSLNLLTGSRSYQRQTIILVYSILAWVIWLELSCKERSSKLGNLLQKAPVRVSFLTLFSNSVILMCFVWKDHLRSTITPISQDGPVVCCSHSLSLSVDETVDCLPTLQLKHSACMWAVRVRMFIFRV